MRARALTVLARFPAHMEATRPGKLLGQVVGSLAVLLDADAAELGRIRRAHRVGEVEEVRDLLLIAGLHGIDRGDLALLFLRFARARALLAELLAADAATREAIAEALLDLWGLEAPPPRLPLLAPPAEPGAEPDLAAAAERLAAAARAALTYRGMLEALRGRVVAACSIHARGNGGVRAVMAAAANALDLDLGEIVHSADRFWHAARVRDRLRLAGPRDDAGHEHLPTGGEILGLEENPLQRTESDRTGRTHGELFTLIRRGFERALLQVSVTGEGSRTMGPMLVNRDEGHGVGFAGAVPTGRTLVFTEEGRVLLDGADLTSFGYAWQGACFGGEDARADRDFVFDGPGLAPGQKPGRFAVATPENRLDPEAAFPHAGGSLPMPGINVGETRLAFFVQEAHHSAQSTSKVRRVVPRPAVGFLDGSVFAAGAGEERQVAAQVALSWLEHRAYAALLLVPGRFRGLDPDDLEAAEVRQSLARALRRFKPAGVDLAIAFVEDRWVLGAGVLGPPADDPIASLRAGMRLWAEPAPA